MASNTFSSEPFAAKRIEVKSTRTFEEVLANLRAQLGIAPPQTLRVQTDDEPGASYTASESGRAQFEEIMQSRVGPSGFMLFFEVNHGQWLPFYGIHRKAIRLVLGNPLVAITMMRHDITAGLFAPVELLLIDNESDDGSTIIYNQPSSLMQAEKNPDMLAAAQALDGKLQALVCHVTGASEETKDQP